MTEKELMLQVKQWVLDAGEYVKVELAKGFQVQEKSGRSDLVTNVDKATEKLLVTKIRQHYPDDQIIGEEGLGDQVTDLSGRVWVIDPIDGTMNFVKQGENFCIMIGIFQDGQPILGFIYDVMANRFIYGGASVGVFCNTTKLSPVADQSLEEGILATNGFMFSHNVHGTQKIGLDALAVRILGCAGLDFMNVILGKQCAYISNLAPWDYAAGMALAEPLGLICSNLTDETYNLLGGRSYFVVATKTAYDDIKRRVF
ncbi:hypothetical protein CBF34_07425 [Vagococcus penaei]|uniref:Uncharacterized protein n=1 Tax=Vagococcus penaei TaxID=633807 RepID=A0A1Q2D377_9ENTE|nr:inositol monophosphatase family protein [Vagococcus penaei]AQP52807.1 hypothetical protein BW732_00290 [Vagococcus penaei]RSU01148.1 hypothetical protein CBF34_07425 [Vagococcus penaei]